MTRWLVTLNLVCLGLASAIPALVHAQKPDEDVSLFARDNLVAWCIVPFDAKKRGPEERGAMLKRLGFQRFAYDWRAEHVPAFAAEIAALKKHGIRLEAFWFPAQLNKDARAILEVLGRHQIKTQLWITMGDPAAKDQAGKIEAAARGLRPIAEEAAKIGCSVALYNHGGWFGEPENELAIVEHLKLSNVGIVYNLHHGHDHLERFPELLQKLKPHLWAVNLNGMVRGGDKTGKKILPLGQGDADLVLLRTIRASGYRGPIGILGHTMDDAEDRLRDNLDGLDWLVPQLQGKPPGPRPEPRTFKIPAPKANAPEAKTPAAPGPAYHPELVSRLVAAAKATGDVRLGAVVFRSPLFACSGCHKVGKVGGIIGPDLTKVGICLTPDQIVEALLWPKRQVKDEYKAHSILTADGKLHQGYKEKETDKELTLRNPATGTLVRLAKSSIEEQREIGTLMPDGLAEAMTAEQRRDLVRFLMELGRTDGLVELAALHGHTAAPMPLERGKIPKDLLATQHRRKHRRNWLYRKHLRLFRGPCILESCRPKEKGVGDYHDRFFPRAKLCRERRVEGKRAHQGKGQGCL